MTMTTQMTQQPESLKIFFGTEMWERYGFYTVQTLLALYLTLHMGWHDQKVYQLVGSFTALTYLSPVIGGFIADKMLGQKISVLCGVISLFTSYILLALLKTDTGLCYSLAGIAVGTGLLKPNISSLLGNQYNKGSRIRESGFTIFYMGITTGIVLGTTLPSRIEHLYGWSAAFASAAVVMLLALFVFVYGILVYKLEDYQARPRGKKAMISALLLIFGLWLLSFYVLFYPSLANFLFVLVVGLSFYYIIHNSRKAEFTQKIYNYIIGMLCLISVIFWAFYFQMFLSFTLFIERVVESKLLGIDFPPPYYVTIQSVGMLILGYFLSKNRLSKNRVEQTRTIANKFIYAILILILAYSFILSASYFSSPTLLIAPIYIIPAYLLISLAELLLSPVGLSAITLLAAKEQVSTMMGIFFVSLGCGGFLSGKIAAITEMGSDLGSLAMIHEHYTYEFTKIFILLLGASLFCAVMLGMIKWLLKRIPQ